MKPKLFVSLVALICLGVLLALPAGADDPECSGVHNDVNNDGSFNVGDLVYFQNYLWKGGPPPPCPDQADCNGNGYLDIGDYVCMIYEGPF